MGRGDTSPRLCVPQTTRGLNVRPPPDDTRFDYNELAASRREMSLQSSHTDSGMTPIRIN